MKILSLVTMATIVAVPSFAQDTRHADSHEHGVGQLDIAIEGAKIAMELHAPGADIVGFEYEPSSQEDHDAVDAAVAVLAKPLGLFGVPAQAGCQVIEANAHLDGADAHEGEHDDHDDHKDEHDDHKDEHKDEHDDHKDEDHAEHSDHDDDEGENHTEFHAKYLLECADINAVTEIKFPYFDAFANAKELELQVVTDTGASAFEIERDEPSVNLKGLF